MAATIRGAAGAVAAVLLASATALGQAPRKPECPPPSASGPQPGVSTPQAIEGEVVNVDRQRGLVTLRGTDGRTYEFRASRETLAELERGDRIEAKLRTPPPGC